MKLTKRDVPVRLDTKLNKNISIDGGVMTFGAKDDYPNMIERIVSGSVTAKAAADTYARFLIGKGFKTPGINDKVIGTDGRGKKVTVLDLLRLAAESVSLNNGLYIHASVNAESKIKDPTLFAFKHCRFTKLDDNGYTNSIVFNQSFGEEKFKKSENKTFDVWNESKEITQNLIRINGSVEAYGGQVYFQFWDNRYIYPLSPFDSVYLDADTENEIALYKNREVRNGFMLRHILRVAEFTNDEDRQLFIRMIDGVEGGNGSRVILLEEDTDQETGELKQSGAFKIEKVESNINDKLFENWETSISNKIRKANKALPAILIDYETGALGNTSGEAIIQASNYYNAMTADDRALMSRVFKDIFSRHYDDTLANIGDWSIEPLNFEIKKEVIL